MDIGVEGDKKNSERKRINMTNKLICPDDGLECVYPEQHENGCWNCPKIQGVFEKMKEVDRCGEEQTQ